MTTIAVLCKDNKDAGHLFCELVNRLRAAGITMNRLIWHQSVIGNKKCRVRVYSCSDGREEWRGTKVDMTFGFSVKQQHEILKEGCRASRKYIEMRDDYAGILSGYFEAK